MNDTSFNAIYLGNKFKLHIYLKTIFWLFGEIIHVLCLDQNISQKFKPLSTKSGVFFLHFCCVLVLTCFCVVLCFWFCTGHCVMVPLNLTCLHCLQHSFFERPLNLYYERFNTRKTIFSTAPTHGVVSSQYHLVNALWNEIFV